MIKTHPILFNAEMIRALLDGRKTQTRRVCKIQHGSSDALERMCRMKFDPAYKCLYGKVGDFLWVRESMKAYSAGSISFAQYTADGKITRHEWWKPVNHCPSIHMPRWASRLTLKILDISVEPVQHITPLESMAEGVSYEKGYQCPRDAYKILWDSINSGRGYGWDANPWVWVVEFEVIRKNVDCV